MRLLEYAKNIYSQTGEDGVLSKILDMLGTRDRWCVEFGAWDGQHLSNTFSLIQNSGYSGVLIEGSRKRYEDLLKRFGSNSKVIALNSFVGFKSDDGLDKLLVDTPIPKDFDLLSIDIDGNDYHVWDAVSSYFPKVVCVEFNPSIPTEVDFIQVADRDVSQGASLLAFVRLGTRKGYELVAVTSFNAIFVRSEYFSLFGITDNSPRTLREDISCVTHVFCGFDGTVFFRGSEHLPYHGIKYAGRIRPLPKLFRRYPGNFGPLTSKLFGVYRKFSRMVGRA
ncbi:MAG: hypothetical protein M3Y82_01785 [Verrucomicrobiota bacterium]|nr:hypothetical protein [Verrucomicrobiota bacterium]